MRFAFASDLLRRHVHRRAADHEAAAAERADAVRDDVGVAVHHVHVIDVDAECVADHLCEGRLLALAVGRRARHYGDAAGRLDAQLGALPGAGARGR